jgi:hypothetical protein
MPGTHLWLRLSRPDNKMARRTVKWLPKSQVVQSSNYSELEFESYELKVLKIELMFEYPLSVLA